MLPTEREQIKGKERAKAHIRKRVQGVGKERVKRGKSEREKRKQRDHVFCVSDLHPKTYFI